MIGVTVTRFEVDSDREGAWLEGTKNGTALKFRFEVEADCCSKTWIEGIAEESALVGHTIRAVEDIDMPDLGQSDKRDDDEIKYYGLAITTERGRCVIDYRNASNGYYGGSMRITKAA